jgi:hypothetical protein
VRGAFSFFPPLGSSLFEQAVKSETNVNNKNNFFMVFNGLKQD